MEGRGNEVEVVRLVYLARLREAFGTGGEAYPIGAPVDVATIVDDLRARGGAFARELAAGRAYKVAVNHEIAGPRSVVGPGDEVAFLPPVTGG
ncbi:MAG: MoaD/ThiS family protein [Burkholderiales bacterium]